MTRKYPKSLATLLVLSGLGMTGCSHHHTADRVAGPQHDRPFPLGQVTDSHWETQQTNAEAADFIFYDHEFVGDTPKLAPGAKRHLEQVALRLEHVPFPILIEVTMHHADPALDQARRMTIIQHLGRMGIVDIEDRVVIAEPFAEGITAIEAERAYYNGIIGGRGGFGGGGFGGGIGGGGGTYR